MDQEKDTPERMPRLGLLRGTFYALFGVLRAAAILAAIALAGAGLFIAYDVYLFLRHIVEEPQGIVREWQVVVQADRAPAAAPFEPIPEAAAPPAASMPEAPEAPDAPAPAEVGEASPDAPAPASQPEEVPDAAATTEPPSEPDAIGEAADAEDWREERGLRRPGLPAPRAPEPQVSWIALAERALDSLEAGNVNWLLGLALLVAFCWIIGKIPGMLVLAGTRLLVELFKSLRDAP
ncbi:MAG: hypothetical protein KF886_24230 [Candidatus Hydrogenedentes bacterium]|nr:hypothetical protein [Candidatus Hydrogenedentota bacterium]